MLVAITSNKKDCKRDIALQDVQIQEYQNSSTKAAAAAASKRCRGSFSVPRWQLTPQQRHREREAQLQGQTPGHLKGSGTRGAEKGTWQWHFSWRWLFVTSWLNVIGTWPEKALLAFPMADNNSLARVYRYHWCKQDPYQVTVIDLAFSGTQKLSRIRTPYQCVLNKI